MDAAENVTMELPAAAPEANDAVKPAGNALVESVAVPVKPPKEVWLIVSATLPPCGRLTPGCEAAREKPGAAGAERVAAKITTLRLAGRVRLFTVFVLLSAKE